MPFIEPFAAVQVEQLDARRWILLEGLRYEGAKDKGGDCFEVPPGYITDFASVPRVLIALIPVFGKYTPAAILHDRLLTDYLPQGLISSVDADGVFRRVLRELKVPTVKRWLMWTGVRWGAVFSKVRRPGSLRTLPQVLLISVPAFVPVLLLVTVTALVLAVYALLELLISGRSHSIST